MQYTRGFIATGVLMHQIFAGDATTAFSIRLTAFCVELIILTPST